MRSSFIVRSVCCVLVFIFSSTHVHAQAPAPSRTPAFSTFFDCKSPPSNPALNNRFREHCRSMADPQAGFPYHTCKVISDPISGVMSSVLLGAKSLLNSMLPTVLVDAGFADILLGQASATTTALNGVVNTAATLFFLNPNATDIKFGYDVQYFGGCNAGSICAQSRDFSKMPIGVAIEGDNVCIPQSDFSEYIKAKQQIQGGANIDLKTVLTQMNKNKESLYKSKPLVELCMRNAPNGGNILDYILLKKSGVDLTTNYPITSHLDSFHNQMYLDLFYTDKANWKMIEDNMDEIERVLGKTRVSSSGLPMILWTMKISVKNPTVVSRQELKGIVSCLKAANDGKLYTSIGNIQIEDLGTFLTNTVFGFLMGIAGAFTLGCAIYSAISIQMSQGGEGYTKAKETLMHCLSGLALIIFATFMLRFIGVDILRLPGLG